MNNIEMIEFAKIAVVSLISLGILAYAFIALRR